MVVETNMTAIDCHWNHNGTVLAAAGCTNEQSNAVQFFSAYGEVCVCIGILNDCSNYEVPFL